MHCDIACKLPLHAMMKQHAASNVVATIVGKKVAEEEVPFYGMLITQEGSEEIVHFTEHPEVVLSNTINCGIYLFSPSIFEYISKARLAQAKKPTAVYEPSVSGENLALSLEADVFSTLARSQNLHVHHYDMFWSQIKTAGRAVSCAAFYMTEYAKSHPGMLEYAGGKTTPGIAQPELVGYNVIHPDAVIHPSAKIGPNVCIQASVRIGAGARIANSIVLEDCEIKEHACILNSIIGWNSVICQWARVAGRKDYSLASERSTKEINICVLGCDVRIEAEICVRQCIVLPHKSISGNVDNQIIL